jgi:hypothetical protein
VVRRVSIPFENVAAWYWFARFMPPEGPSAMASYAHVCGLCGGPFAILIPPGAEETERDKLCAGARRCRPHRLSLPAPSETLVP